MTVSLALCIAAVVLWFIRSFQAFFNLNTRVHLGWLGLALWGLSLILR